MRQKQPGAAGSINRINQPLIKERIQAQSGRNPRLNIINAGQENRQFQRIQERILSQRNERNGISAISQLNKRRRTGLEKPPESDFNSAKNINNTEQTKNQLFETQLLNRQQPRGARIPQTGRELDTFA